jgi:hypothetical protein
LIESELFYTDGLEGVRRLIITSVDGVADVLKLAHSVPMGGHSGINATLSKVSGQYFWHSMKGDVHPLSFQNFADNSCEALLCALHVSDSWKLLQETATLLMDKLPAPPTANASMKHMPPLLPAYGDG